MISFRATAIRSVRLWRELAAQADRRDVIDENLAGIRRLEIDALIPGLAIFSVG
jgi:hypothetical protein